MLFRRFFLLSPLILSSAFAQTAVLTCATSAVPPTVRAEGITERTGDILLSCSGGQPNAQVAGNLIVSLNVNVTNHILSDGSLDVTLQVDNGAGTTSFPGRQFTTNAVAFNGVVFNASAQGKAEIRMVNLRGNASQLGFVGDRYVTATVSFTGAGIAVPNSAFIVAVPQRGLLASSNGRIICGPGGSPVPESLSVMDMVSYGTVFTTTRVTEGFASSFAPLADAASFRADSGVRIITRYTGFPAGARLFVPDVIAGSTADVPTSAGDMGYPAAGGTYTSGQSQLLLVRVTGADANGAGGRPAVQIPAGTTPFSTVGELPVAGGSAYAVYEVVDANPFRVESAQFPTFLGLAANPSLTAVETGFSINFAAVSNVITQSPTEWIPRFIQTTPPGDCSVLGDCNAGYFPRMQLDTTPIQMTAPAGQPATKYVPIRNIGSGVLRWTASVSYAQGAANWLRLDSAQGVNNSTLRMDAITTGLQPGTYQATLSIDGGPFAGVQTIPVTLVVTPAQNTVVQAAISGVSNAADSEQKTLVAGSFATIMGTRLTGNTLKVTFDGVPAAVTYASEKQLNVIVPAEMAGKQTASLVVSVDGTASAPVTVNLGIAAPAIFPGAVLNQDNTVNGASAPAATGSVVQVFATGLPAAGVITAKVHDVAIPVPVYGGAAPGMPGVQQVNIQIPGYLPTMQTYVYVCGGPSADKQECSPAQKIWIVQQ